MQNRIRELRKQYHMTQVRLSIELEVAQETISAYENQRHFPSFPQLIRLSELFNASIDYIMGLSDVRNPVFKEPEDRLQNLITLGRRLNERQLEVVTAYIQGVLDSPR